MYMYIEIYIYMWYPPPPLPYACSLDRPRKVAAPQNPGTCRLFPLVFPANHAMQRNSLFRPPLVVFSSAVETKFCKGVSAKVVLSSHLVVFCKGFPRGLALRSLNFRSRARPRAAALLRHGRPRIRISRPVAGWSRGASHLFTSPELAPLCFVFLLFWGPFVFH